MTDNGMEMNNQRWEKHSDFLADFAGNIAYLLVTFESGNSREKIESVEHLVKTLSFSAFKHAEGHCREDFENGVFEPGESVEGNQCNNVSENQVVGEISVSGDRVKREETNVGSSWDEAKQEPHIYVALEPDSADNNSVIKTQEECAKRFAEGEAVRRNYAGIND